MPTTVTSYIPEPVEIDEIPVEQGTLTRSQRRAIREQVIALAREVAPLVRRVTVKNKRSWLDRVFARLARRERFALPLPGINQLSWGLRLPEPQRWKRDDALLDALFVLRRLHVARRIIEELADEKIPVSLPFVLTIFRREGGFALPLSLEDLHLGVVPPPMAPPNWPITTHFLGPHYAFHLEKEAPPWVRYGPLIRGVRERIQCREQLVKQLARRGMAGDELEWLSSAKQAAFTMFLFLLGGLDYMTAGVTWPGAFDYSHQRLLFRYLYARNRAAMQPHRFLADLIREGEVLFDAVCSVERTAFLQGRLSAGSLTLVVQGSGEAQQHYVVPVHPVAFTTQIVREAVVALEAMRSAPLLCGGRAFDPPLPPQVAYIRYNGGDVNFTVMVLNLLNRVLNEKSLLAVRRSRDAVSRLRYGLSEFTEARHRDVWTVLTEWESGTEETNVLKAEPIRKGGRWRAALLEDAQGDLRSLPGPAELRLRDEVNADGKMDTALPIIEALTQKNLWDAFAEVMVSRIGSRRRPWMGHAPNRIGNEVGLNVLRFDYTLRGYEAAFPSRPPPI